MLEHRMTDQTATTIALHGLINDMHHVLGRIAWALTLGTVIEGVMTAVDLLRGHWIEGGFDLLFAVCVGLMAVETAKRQRKYHPATKRATTTTTDETRTA